MRLRARLHELSVAVRGLPSRAADGRIGWADEVTSLVPVEGEPGRGELVAVDLVLLADGGLVLRERFTSDRDDLGVVWRDGEWVGEVLEFDGAVLTVCLFP